MLIDKPDPQAIADSVHTFFSNKLSDQYIVAVQSLKNELSWESLGKAIVEFSAKVSGNFLLSNLKAFFFKLKIKSI